MPSALAAVVVLCLFAPLNAVISATANAVVAGFDWGLGNRNTPAALPPWAGRLSRAHANLIENLPSFIGLVMVVQLTGGDGVTARLAAWVFVATRLAFFAVYAAGITLGAIRTLLYFGSLGALGTLGAVIATTGAIVPG